MKVEIEVWKVREKTPEHRQEVHFTHYGDWRTGRFILHSEIHEPYFESGGQMYPAIKLYNELWFSLPDLTK